MRRSWGFHAIVLPSVLLALLALILATMTGDRVLMFAFFFLPLALVYAVISTAMVALLRPGRPWVALAHAIALTLAVFAPLFFTKPG